MSMVIIDHIVVPVNKVLRFQVDHSFTNVPGKIEQVLFSDHSSSPGAEVVYK